MKKVNAIVTIPPYAPFIEEVARHPVVSGLRLNTVMPTKGSLDDVLKKLQDQANGKDLWVDLKARQLRVAGYWAPPFTEVELTHPIKVDTPTKALFTDGRERATIVEVDGNKLIMLEGPRRVIGPGESLNILDSSLEIDGFLTDTDLAYIEAGNNVGVMHYMLSFVEHGGDVAELQSMVGDALIAAKIESRKGMQYVRKDWSGGSRLMGARGDLFVELSKPHYVTRAMEEIVGRDPDAIAASRIFSSFANSLEPSCADIGDVDNLLRMGYRTFMLGDETCMRRDSVISSLNLLQAIAGPYE